jgi:TRAP-type C4-dicarboxylate transport system permease small subunit
MSGQPDDHKERLTLVDRCGDLVTQACLTVAAAALIGVVAINGANVLARYVFISPFSWAEEAMLFLMILSVFSGAIAVTWRGIHIRIDTFIDLAPPAVRQVVLATGALVSIAVLIN